MNYRAPKGTRDILPEEAAVWNMAEEKFRRLASNYAYGEIRTPAFEDIDLFIRSIGDDSDIISKEMYDFVDKGGRHIALKPEGTAPVVRAFIQNNMQAVSPLNKLFYISSMFRYDRPQAGRYREFHQLGVEAIGSTDPLLDVEVISLAMTFFKDLGLQQSSLKLNSVGCGDCRTRYVEAMRAYLEDMRDGLCEDCRRRYVSNPLRILDCKKPACRQMILDAPEISAFICDPCRRHFDEVRRGLEALGIPFIVDPQLVRGLDYYTRTAFEIVHEGLGAQSSIAGGGRYDRLVRECGGPDLPGMGFAAGIERLMLALQAEERYHIEAEPCRAFVVTLGDEARLVGLRLLYEIRAKGLQADMDYLGRSLKAQLRAADKSGCRFAVILGEDEIARGKALVKNLLVSEQRDVEISGVAGYLSEYRS